MITQQELKEILNYDKDTGIFTWKIAISNRVYVGKEVSSKRNTGYISIGIKNKDYLVHRLAWLYVYGYLPNYIDHVNNIRADNRIENLREVTKTQNNQNSAIRKNNTSKVKNVTWHKQCKKWHVSICANNKRMSFGLYNDLELAKLVAEEARVKYHKQYANHGRK
jgi:hypothetical protein